MWFWPIIVFHLMGISFFLIYALYNVKIQGGILSYILIFCIFVFKTIIKKKNEYILIYSVLDILVLLYIIWNLMTLTNVILLNRSVMVYAKGISYCLFPLFGYFVFSFQNNYFKRNILNKYIIILTLSTTVTIVLGIILIIFPTEFYINYVLSEGVMTASDPLWVARLISYFGDPSIVGNISAISIPFIMYLKSQKIKYINSPLIYPFLIIIVIAGVILSFARSAWIATIIISLFYILLGLRKNLIKTIMLIAFLSALFWSYSYEDNINDNIFLMGLQNRFMSSATAFSERYFQIEYAMNNINENPLGIGLGQAGHKSFSGDTLIGVYDNNYMRIFTELGIVGIVLFLLIMFFSIFLILKFLFSSCLRDNLTIMIGCVIFVFYFQALGSNVFDLHYSSFLFWSFLGILSLKTKKYNQIAQLNPVSCLKINKIDVNNYSKR